MIFYYCHFGDCQFKSRKFNDVVNHREREHGMYRVKSVNPHDPPTDIPGGIKTNMIWAYKSVGEEE